MFSIARINNCPYPFKVWLFKIGLKGALSQSLPKHQLHHWWTKHPRKEKPALNNYRSLKVVPLTIKNGDFHKQIYLSTDSAMVSTLIWLCRLSLFTEPSKFLCVRRHECFWMRGWKGWEKDERPLVSSWFAPWRDRPAFCILHPVQKKCRCGWLNILISGCEWKWWPFLSEGDPP